MRNYVIFFIVLFLTAFFVAAALLSGNFGIVKVLSLFERQDPYRGKVMLFYGDGCSQCTKVDDFVKSNRAQDKVAFVELEVFNSPHNEKILIEKAKMCGLETEQIGVPFLWDDLAAECVVGYTDIIHWFKVALKKP